MLHIPHLRDYVIVPTCKFLAQTNEKMYSESAVNLLLGTCLVESGGRYLRQHNDGPALGLWQMEPATHDDIWDNFLVHRGALAGRVMLLLADEPRNKADQLRTNLLYACAMARLHYWRDPEPLPEADDAMGHAKLWKRHYNSRKGRGTIGHFTEVWKFARLPVKQKES